jgi:16S rRNA (guanine527-N7)-methyltransferase
VPSGPSTGSSCGAVDPRELAAEAAALGCILDDATLRDLGVYLELLMRWNRAMNLTGARTWQEALRTLVVDSLRLAPFLEQLPLPASPLCWDPGAGAGLPGIPLRLLWRRGEYWMIEAREKRALFLSTVLARLDMPGTHVHRGRLEQFMAGHPAGQAPPDLVLSRAFMPWRKLLALVGDRLGADGAVVFLFNEPPPEAAWAAPIEGRRWIVQACLPYLADGRQRTLCAVRPEA